MDEVLKCPKPRPKKNDEYYTPEPVYEAVLNWVCKEYGVDREKVCRPFWPGGDYERFPYKEDSVVVDNPPFSITTKIVNFYIMEAIPFFLFVCGNKTFENLKNNVCAIIIDLDIKYKNGDKIISTAFITNMEHNIIARTAPELRKYIVEASGRCVREKQLFGVPKNIVNCAKMEELVRLGKDYRIPRDKAVFMRNLDVRKELSMHDFYGQALLCASSINIDEVIAEARAAVTTEYPLSAREKAIVARLDGEPVEDDQYSLLDEGEK